MKLTDFVVRDAVVPDLDVETKEQAIRGLVASLRGAGAIGAQDEEGIVAAIMKREELGSTGIGRGVAVPHTKHPNVDRLIATVAICHPPGARCSTGVSRPNSAPPATGRRGCGSRWPPRSRARRGP